MTAITRQGESARPDPGRSPIIAPAKPQAAGPASRWPGRLRTLAAGNSVLWLALVAAAFLTVELTPSLRHMSLGADEITYISQSSKQLSGIGLPPVHSRGPGILALPVTALTTSLQALRIWMSVLSAVGLLLALLCWRGLRPAWVLAIAGVILGSLGIAQLTGVQAMPDFWVAVGALSVTGLYLQAATGRMRTRVIAPLLAFATFFLILQRLQDAAFLLAPLVIATLAVPAWRQLRVLAAVLTGTVLGLGEWAGESIAFFGGVSSRWAQMHQEPPKFGFYFTLPYQLRVLNGPWYCRPGACVTWHYPGLTFWWAALLGLALLGVIASWRTARGTSLIVVAAATSLLLAYTAFVPYAAPRYLLPVVALMALPAADGLAWLVTRKHWWRPAGIAAAAGFLITGAITQHVVRVNEVNSQTLVRDSYLAQAVAARLAGVRAPCVESSPAAGYYLGCTAPWTGQTAAEVLASLGGTWHQVPGVVPAVWVRGPAAR
jgi:hypothetical protein